MTDCAALVEAANIHGVGKFKSLLRIELPLVVHAGQAARIRGHLEVGRQFYNAVLSEGQKRLRRMRADPAWQAARAIPRVRAAARSKSV